MKMKLLFLITFLIFINKSYSVDIGRAEILIRNYSNYNIQVKIYPASAIFSGYGVVTPQYNYKYCFSRASRNLTPEWPIPFLIGGDKVCTPGLDNYILIDFDDGAYQLGTDFRMLGGISFGLWKMDLISSASSDTQSYYLDYRDFNIGSYVDPYFMDIYVSLYGIENDSVKILYVGAQQTVAMSDTRFHNRTIKIWDQVGRLDSNGQQIPPLVPSKGTFSSSNEISSYLKYPFDATKFGAVDFENPGDLGMNLQINHTVTTRDTLFSNPTNIIISPNTSLKILQDTFYMKTSVGGKNNLIVSDSADLVIAGTLIVGYNNVLTLKSKGAIRVSNKLIFQAGSAFCNEGGLVSGSSRITYEKGYHYYYHSFCYQSGDFYVNDSAKIILEDSATLEIPDSVTLHFTGKETALFMNPNSKLKLGAGSKLVFDSSASLKANGATFTSLDSNGLWEGIVLKNTDCDTILNCTFKNAKNSISIINSGNFSYLRRIIRNNVFYVPSGGDYKAIYGENNYRILIAGNTFNLPVVSSGSYIYTGVYLKNSSTSGTAMEDEEPVPVYFINIINNTFNNGSTSIILANYISSSWPCYIGNNTFNNASDINLIGIKLNGSIKNNNFTSTDVPMGVHLINSSPDMFGNSITARDISLHLAGHCYPNLAPYISDDYLVWKGGKNTLSAELIDNVQLSSTGCVFTDWGNNSFNTETSTAEHIYGFVDSSFASYKSRRNCWSPQGIAKISLKKYFDSASIASLNSSEDCEEAITPVSVQTDYLGSELYDTVLVSEDNTGDYPVEEDILYLRGRDYMNPDYYNNAIITFKYLIDNYPDYKNIEAAADKLYICYQALDTTEDTSYRNTLFGNLKFYLEDKIESGDYSGSGDFEDVSYDIVLTCETILGEYDDALNGYEFISLFHPDPNIRLIASWDYEEVEALINSGYGGGEKQFQISNDKLQIENQFQVTSYELRVEELREKRELQRMEEVINDDPVLRKMKESFEKKSEERKEKVEKDTSKKSKLSETAKENIRKSEQLDNLKEDRAKRNILESALLNPREKEKRRMEDMILTTRNIRNQADKIENVNVVLQYKLEQNYPNPFNPETKINFTIPKDGKVTLKIYDILGKEVKTLVNEFRNSGSYQVTFSGINLSSGVYYYKIEAGSFTQVRKMVLLK